MNHGIAILMLLIAAGCTGVNTNIRSAHVNVGAATPLYAAATLLLEDQAASIAQTTPEQEGWELPPFTWAPGSCMLRSHEAMWPDYSTVSETECTWWFFPKDRDISICNSSWALEDGSWTMIDMSCRILEKAQR